MSLAVISVEKVGSKKFNFVVLHGEMGRLQPDGDASVTEFNIPETIPSESCIQSGY